MTSKIAFELMIDSYLEGLKNKKFKDKRIPELEVRFGTGIYSKNNDRGIVKPISKIDFDNVVKHLYNAGFSCENDEGQHLLRIFPDTYHINQNNETKKSKSRLEIVGLDLIQSYCERGEDLREVLNLPQILNSSSPDDMVKFTLKTDGQTLDQKYLAPVDFEDFGFRVSYQYEQNSSPSSDLNNTLLTDWITLKKTFRYLNRVKFKHPEYPIIADISIIRSSKKSKKDSKQIPEYTLKNAGLFNNDETYEIELEIDNSKVNNLSTKELLVMIRKTIRIILSGLQQSNYPIGYKEKGIALRSYMELIHGTEYNINKQIETMDFIGPNSLTLQIDNIIPIKKEISIINIQTNYSVTDKADGKRTLLHISDNGRLYLIDTNMNIIFTGSVLEKEQTQQRFRNSLLDGEFIKLNKHGKLINLFAAFDIYYKQKAYIGNLDFETFDSAIDNKIEKKNSRYDELKKFTNEMKFRSIVDDSVGPCNFHIKCKDFAFTTNIFSACKKIHSSVFDEYDKDGLIFTPVNMGVGGSRNPLKNKMTWRESFKWKPPKYNTIDFLVNIKKNNKGNNEIHNLYLDGNNLQSTGNNIKQYQVIELMCGFSKRNDGYLNPLLELINGEIAPQNENIWEYKKIKFYPKNPADQNACYCNILLTDNVMTTEDGDFFENDMIVEFRYDLDRIGLTDDKAWKWVPIRVRYDKTTELRTAIKERLNGKKTKPNYGNSYAVADSNWTSIHNPITEHMITTGENIPTTVTDTGVYYNKTNEVTVTQGLRDFHNLYVKRKLILGVSSLIKSDKRTLIDYAVGKGGDLPKWIDAKLSFVFGIDVKDDNIKNQLNGACARYLTEQKRYQNSKNFPKALFAVGNSELNIRDNSAYGKTPGNVDEKISNSIFGVGKKEDFSSMKGVFDQFDIAKNGFNISSVQFALHYFFKDYNTIHQFMINIAECTCEGGYFIGTCYDGKVIFDNLQSQRHGVEDDNTLTNESILIMTKDKKRKMLEIKRLYSQTSFPENEPNLGYTIDVWQESINQNFTEYLVNFTYLIKLMTNYGFVLISKVEAKLMGLPNSSGLFSELFDVMMDYRGNKTDYNKVNYKEAVNMSKQEKQISFMNRYFIFKKVRNIENTKIIQKNMLEEMTTNIIDKIPIVKLNRKIIIDDKPKIVRITKKKAILK